MTFDEVRCRTSSATNPLWNLLKTFVQMVVVWGFCLLYVPGQLFHVERQVGLDYVLFGTTEWMIAGIVTLLVGSVLGLTSAVVMAVAGKGTPLPMDAARTLVLAGPYRYVRNPMAIAGGLQMIGMAMTIGSCFTLAVTPIGWIIWNRVIRPWEERDLERRFGAPYAAYRDAVPCWIPRIRPYVPTSASSSS
jgi:protein-S-isoprenylcysteine O-methyltransferase Ste14